MKTKIVNNTPHVLIYSDGNAGIFTGSELVPSMKAFFIEFDPNATYREYLVRTLDDQDITITSDDLIDAKEITVYKTPSQKREWRISEFRAYHSAEGNTSADSTAFDAVKKEASSRMKSIEKSQARLVMLWKQVKICPRQCENLAQACLDGVKEMQEAYNEKSALDMWLLYRFKKLGQLISSLDNLLSTLGSIQDLLQACGSNWGSMALVVSLPLPPPVRMYSKFDILSKELHWNLETIHYALHLSRDVEFKWNERKVRYVLDGPEVTVAEDMELEQSGGLASADRAHLLSQLENGSILVPGNPLLFFLW